MESRFFKNTLSANTSSSISPTFDLHKTLAHLLIQYPPPDGPTSHSLSGLYAGPTAIAYLLFRLSKSHPDMSIDSRSPQAWALDYLDDRGIPQGVDYSDIDANHCGVANETLASLAVRAVLMQNTSGALALARYADIMLSKDSGGSCEWLYGKAGYLYLLRMVKTWLPTDTVRQAVSAAAVKTIDLILSQGPPWTWHKKQYLGAVHGYVGIVTQIVLTAPQYAPKLQDMVRSLLELQTHAGNWPSSVHVTHHGDDKYVQFCHGAPGFIASLVKIKPFFPTLQARIDDAIERARELVWVRGTLTKEPCLCHGIAGNALTLDKTRMDKMLEYATEEQIKKGLIERIYVPSDEPFALYSGEAGRVWAWMVAEGRGDDGFIGYSDV